MQPWKSEAPSPRVVVNPFNVALSSSSGATGVPPQTPASPTAASSPYSMEAMAAELQRSQAALARLRLENRKYKEHEELENAPLSAGILAWSEAKAVRTMQTSNMCNGAFLIAAAVGSFFIPGDTAVATFARIVLVCYMVCVSASGIAFGCLSPVPSPNQHFPYSLVTYLL